MLSKLTLLGLHEYTEGDIWADLTFPEGIDKEIAISEILRQCAEFSVLYANPDFLKAMITQWGNKWHHTFYKWITVLTTEYEPLWNLDVHSTITDNRTRSGDNISNTTAESTASAENIHQNAAYDSESFKNAEKDNSDSSGNISDSTAGEFSEKDDNIHEEYRRGNQGITKSQEMLLDELNVRSWNIYQHIADIFANEMCICIYD